MNATARALAIVASIIAIGLGLIACGDSTEGSGEESQSEARGAESPYGAAPTVDDPALGPDIDAALDRLMAAGAAGQIDQDALDTVAASGDPRLGWLISDLLRFYPSGPQQEALVAAFDELSGADPQADPNFERSPWQSITNHLIAWDLPAPPDYRERKATLFVAVEPGWKPFFADADSAIDWRLLSWGGVPIDDRPEGDPAPCPGGCIPALDDPALTPASEGDWFPDGGTIFGVTVGGESVAFPKNIMEVHEMVNVTIGGRRLGIPYCTLCGSAQAYFLDDRGIPGPEPVLRTSGLLSRSNKVMYDLESKSVFDTFTGEALSGTLHDAGVKLAQTTVVASTWGAWKRDHPDTKIVAEDGGIGRDYPADPLGGRDDNGPIFPIGDVDPRLPAQADVIGAIAPGGQPVAFPADQATAALERGEAVTAAGVELAADGDGLRASTVGGRELATHQAFWFAWSQFHPEAELWEPRG